MLQLFEVDIFIGIVLKLRAVEYKTSTGHLKLPRLLSEGSVNDLGSHCFLRKTCTKLTEGHRGGTQRRGSRMTCSSSIYLSSAIIPKGNYLHKTMTSTKENVTCLNWGILNSCVYFGLQHNFE